MKFFDEEREEEKLYPDMIPVENLPVIQKQGPTEDDTILSQMEKLKISETPITAQVIDEPARSPAESDPLREKVREDVMKKYGIGKYSPEARAKVLEENDPNRVDFRMVMSAIGSKNPAAAIANIKKQRAMNIEDFDKRAEFERQNDPESEESKMAQELAAQMGVKNPERLTAARFKQFSPVFEKLYAMKEKGAERDESRSYRQQMLSLANKKLDYERNSPKGQYEALPEENKQIIKNLAQDSGTKMGIKNSIDAVLSKWDTLDDEGKLQQGRQLIKVLNSTQGQDAVGLEESKRLGGKLEYALGNIFNSNPTQFGRDLPGFKKDAEVTTAALGDAVTRNKKAIDQSYGRKGADAPKDSNTAQLKPSKPGNGFKNGVEYEPDGKGGWVRYRPKAVAGQ